MAPVVKVGHCCSSSRSQTQIRDSVNRDHTGNNHTENEPNGADTHSHQLLFQKLQVVLFHLSTVRKTASYVEAPLTTKDKDVSHPR